MDQAAQVSPQRNDTVDEREAHRGRPLESRLAREGAQRLEREEVRKAR